MFVLPMRIPRFFRVQGDGHKEPELGSFAEELVEDALTVRFHDHDIDRELY